MRAVTFDFGQTLAELDYDFLVRRLSERGASLDAAKARAATSDAWARYGQAKSTGHALAWRAMMELMLERGGVPAARLTELGDWLWSEQPRQNLWRKPLPGMIELVRELRRARVPLGILSNSEGQLQRLVDELGWSGDFEVVVDSGRVGVDKPDARIFQLACTALAVEASQLLHVGDSWEADVEGALNSGSHAVWFDARHRERSLPSRTYGAADAGELREVLARLGLVS